MWNDSFLFDGGTVILERSSVLNTRIPFDGFLHTNAMGKHTDVHLTWIRMSIAALLVIVQTENSLNVHQK